MQFQNNTKQENVQAKPLFQGPAETASFVASDFKKVEKNTLVGFVTITLPSGLKIKDCSLHSRDSKRWIGLPGKPYTKPDGTTSFVNILEFASNSAKYEFQQLALEAVDELLANGGAA